MLDRLELLISEDMETIRVSFFRSDFSIVSKSDNEGARGGAREKIERVDNLKNKFRDTAQMFAEKTAEFIDVEKIPADQAGDILRRHLNHFADFMVEKVSHAYITDAFNRGPAADANRKEFEQLREELTNAIEVAICDAANGRAGWKRVSLKRLSILERIVSDIKKEPWKALGPILGAILGWIGRGIFG